MMSMSDYFPVNEVAADCGSAKAANMVMLGAYTKIRGFLGEEDLLGAFLNVFGEGKKNLLPLNEKAVSEGAKLV